MYDYKDMLGSQSFCPVVLDNLVKVSGVHDQLVQIKAGAHCNIVAA